MVRWYVLSLSYGMEIEYYGETTTFLGNSLYLFTSFLTFGLFFSALFFINLLETEFLFLHRINLPKRKRRDWLKDFEKEALLGEHDLDAASEASSEPDYNYEFAQMEVIMKTLNSNGKRTVT